MSPLALAMSIAFSAATQVSTASDVPEVADVPALSPGSYALHVDVIGARSVPLLGDVRVRTTTVAWVEVDAEDGALIATERPCSITSDSRMFASRAPASLLRALRPTRWILEVDGPAVRADLGTYTLGFDGGNMPAGSKDARVRDPDGNGRPGALMHVDVAGVGDLELDLLGAWTTRLDGRLVAPGVVAGHVETATEEKILSGLPLAGELGPLRVDARGSRFTLTRLPEGARACDDLRRLARLEPPTRDE